MMLTYLEMEHSHPYWQAVSTLCGVIYFTAWSLSFYPQLILNYQKKTTTGLSPDYININPLGFLGLAMYNISLYFSPLARRQYQSRHSDHLPQVSIADLAFALHALVISLLTLIQMHYYSRRSRVLLPPLASSDDGAESSPLLPDKALIPPTPTTPSLACQAIMLGLVLCGLGAAVMVWLDRLEWLDFVYYCSSVKLVISLVKYIPQVILNIKLRSAEGYAIGAVLLDMTGSVFSFAQLVISSTAIAHDPGAIIGNPAKLGLSNLSFVYGTIFLVQKYWLYRDKTVDLGHNDDGETGEEAISS